MWLLLKHDYLKILKVRFLTEYKNQVLNFTTRKMGFNSISE